jgi:hypothetical protein
MAEPVDSLAGTVRSIARLPLVAVGSGGSLTSAYIAAFLHSFYSGQMAQAVTPYDLLGTSPYLILGGNQAFCNQLFQVAGILTGHFAGAVDPSFHVGVFDQRGGQPTEERKIVGTVAVAPLMVFLLAGAAYGVVALALPYDRAARDNLGT